MCFVAVAAVVVVIVAKVSQAIIIGSNGNKVKIAPNHSYYQKLRSGYQKKHPTKNEQKQFRKLFTMDNANGWTQCLSGGVP